jgi:hypothetical protein
MISTSVSAISGIEKMPFNIPILPFRFHNADCFFVTTYA